MVPPVRFDPAHGDPSFSPLTPAAHGHLRALRPLRLRRRCPRGFLRGVRPGLKNRIRAFALTGTSLAIVRCMSAHSAFPFFWQPSSDASDEGLGAELRLPRSESELPRGDASWINRASSFDAPVSGPRAIEAAPVSWRVPADTLIQTAFDQIHPLRFLARRPRGRAVLPFPLVMSLVPCRTAVVHMFDNARRDFIVVDARGEGAESLVLMRHADDHSAPVGGDGQGAREGLERHPRRPRDAALQRAGSVEHALVAPVIAQGMYLEAIQSSIRSTARPSASRKPTS